MSTNNLPADAGARRAELRDRINTWAGALSRAAVAPSSTVAPENLDFLARDLAAMTAELVELDR
ncbi:MAG: hypothetical protein ABIV94_00090 [Acidimicrobiales bacterium]